MNEISPHILQLMEGYTLPIILVLLTLAIIIYLSRGKIRDNWLSLKTRYRLNHLGIKQITNLQCPDGLDHYFNIDRLILRQDGITLLAHVCYPGKIFCADKIDDWTQMLGKKSYRFKNPLYDLDCEIKAVSACVPDVPVNGFLFFDHQTEFPKGHPDRILRLKEIPDELKRNKQDEVQEKVMSAWQDLLRMAKA